MQYSPKLKMAMEEIKAVVKKYDIAAAVILSDGKGFSEFLNAISPTWSCAFIDHNSEGKAGVRFRVKEAEVGKEKAHELTQDTYRMIDHFAEVMGMNSLVYYELLDQLKEYVEVTDHDSGEITGHEQQNN